ncbi:hypothetical protein DL98DRAFT_540550 [Cadophora sp. DSE1049]|nr:hypothetical protein DL98DRAFT_540550 [Cadophora sp. DSE1049]
MSHNGWTNNSISLSWFENTFLPQSKARLHGEYLVFIESYLEARDKAFTVENIQKAWRKSGIEPWDPALVIDPLPRPIVLPIRPAGSSSRPTTSGSPAPYSYAQTPLHIGNIQATLELVRTDQLTPGNLKLAIIKICKVAEISMAARIILDNHNIELQAAAARKKEKANRVGGNLTAADAREYGIECLQERVNWAYEKLEEETIAKFMHFLLTIFDFKPKKERKKKPWGVAPASPANRRLTTLFQSLAKSPPKPISPIKAKKLPNPLRLSKSLVLKPITKRKAKCVTKKVIVTSKVVILAYKRGVDVEQRINDILRIKSSSGRIIRPTRKVIASSRS